MNSFNEKITALLKKFAFFAEKQTIDDDLKNTLAEAIKSKFGNYDNVLTVDKEYFDLRIATFENGDVKQLFPAVNSVNKTEHERTMNLIKDFVKFEMNDLAEFYGKTDCKTEDLKEFVNFTYRPVANKSGESRILGAFFNIGLFIFNDGRLEFSVKPTVNTVLTSENWISDEKILRLLQ